MEKVRKFESNGMLWNDGEVPCCSYCDRTIDEVESLHETTFSGELCCEDSTCREDYLSNALSEEVRETTED